MKKFAAAFGRFWYDFIVGDSMVLAIGSPAVLGFGFLFARSNEAWAAQILLPVAVVVTLLISLPLRGD
jgi:uncharacterized membrane protein YtjA (UPF0391 family)